MDFWQVCQHTYSLRLGTAHTTFCLALVL